MPQLSASQDIFLNHLNTKYRAFVGGFGCVSGDTKVFTEGGLVPICEITSPVRVLSFDESSHKFVLSLSGGAFPKGKASLYRITTGRGLFEASGHHRLLSSSGSYVSVESLRVGDEVISAYQCRILTSLGLFLKSFSLNAPNLTEKDVNYLGGYADAARLYGQQFLEVEENDQAFAPLQRDAHKSSRSFGFSFFSYSGVLDWLKSKRSRLCQSFFHKQKSYFSRLAAPPASSASNQKLSLFFGRILHYLRKGLQYPLNFFCRHIGRLSSFVFHSLVSSTSKTTILGIDRIESKPFYDMQVINTNNYICENGLIHHNSGKTFIGCTDLCNFAAKNPGTVQGYFGPTYGSIKDIFYPTMDEAAHGFGFSTVIRVSDKELDLKRGRKYYGTIKCRSMDNPDSIVGFKIANGLVDEIDTLPTDKARNAWRKIVARGRLKIDGVVNGLGVTTTPEGFKFVYETFAKNPTASYSMVQASTYENAQFLPDDYIETLIESYPPELISAYLNGEFVNLTSGSVYSSYDRARHRSSEEIQPKEHLYIGQDFNVGAMASVIYVKRGEVWHAVGELVNLYDTPQLIQTLKERYPQNGITIYPDATGSNRKTNNASTSDISLLSSAGFNVRANNRNPFVKDRVLSVNQAFANGKLYINDLKCPETSNCLERQAYDKNGVPDKKSGFDHQVDAAGYPIAFEMPVLKPIANMNVNFTV